MRTILKAMLLPDRVLGRLAGLVPTLKKIHELEIDAGIKRQIRRTYWHTFFLRRFDSEKNVADIMGYTVRFFRFSNLVYLFEHLFLDQEYHFLTKQLDPYIIDCGSNVGMSVLYFKTLYPGAEIMAFEPDAETFACLEANIRENNLRRVYPKRQALSNRAGRIDFYYDRERPGSLLMSTLQNRMPKDKQSVESVCLSACIDRPVDFLKLDIEGAEGDVLEDLAGSGKLNWIKQMVIEYHHQSVREASSLSQMLVRLQDAGFGFQVESRLPRPFKSQPFQDILIYAYLQSAMPSPPPVGM